MAESTPCRVTWISLDKQKALKHPTAERILCWGARQTVLRWLSDGGGSVSLELHPSRGGPPGVGCPVRIQIFAILCPSSTISNVFSYSFSFLEINQITLMCEKFFEKELRIEMSPIFCRILSKRCLPFAVTYHCILLLVLLHLLSLFQLLSPPGSVSYYALMKGRNWGREQRLKKSL